MEELFKNPLFYILIVNILILVWNLRSWRKNIREKWMNDLRESGAEAIGAAELIYSQTNLHNIKPPSPDAMSNFIAKEQKLLLLFAHNEEEKKKIEEELSSLLHIAQVGSSQQYRKELNKLSSIISSRILKEWNAIK